MIVRARDLIATEFERDVIAGLSASPKTIPCKYLYDARGSALFEEICRTPEYYPTPTELSIIRAYRDEMIDFLGEECLLIEPGAGAGVKTELLLEHLDHPAGYVPIEISHAALQASVNSLEVKFPALRLLPIHADFTRMDRLNVPMPTSSRRAVFFPASTIGNFSPDAAVRLLQRFARLAGAEGGILIGVDLLKDPGILHAAYNDRQGVTAQFNLNLLHRINSELHADIPVDRFRHLAFFRGGPDRVEMHLESLDRRSITVAGRSFLLQRGETICTEHSHKYSLEGFASIAHRAGLNVAKAWTDVNRWFSVHWLVPARRRL